MTTTTTGAVKKAAPRKKAAAKKAAASIPTTTVTTTTTIPAAGAAAMTAATSRPDLKSELVAARDRLLAQVETDKEFKKKLRKIIRDSGSFEFPPRHHITDEELLKCVGQACDSHRTSNSGTTVESAQAKKETAKSTLKEKRQDMLLSMGWVPGVPLKERVKTMFLGSKKEG